MRELRKNGYLSENVIDIVVTLVLYKLFGFQIALLIAVSAIMADMGMIVKRLYATPTTGVSKTPDAEISS